MAGMDGWMVEKRPGGGHGFASKRISVNIELVGWGARGKVFGDMLMTPDEKTLATNCYCYGRGKCLRRG